MGSVAVLLRAALWIGYRRAHLTPGFGFRRLTSTIQSIKALPNGHPTQPMNIDANSPCDRCRPRTRSPRLRQSEGSGFGGAVTTRSRLSDP